MKYRYRVSYKNLWSDSHSYREKPKIKQAIGGHESYCKKSIDDMCLQADLASNLPSYLEAICSGMIRIIGQGIAKEQIIKHDLAFNKLLRLGEDVIECSKSESDLYYMGLFIEAKIPSSWFKLKFYELVKGLIEKVLNRAGSISREIRIKIVEELRKVNETLYKLHFAKKNAVNST